MLRDEVERLNGEVSAALAAELSAFEAAREVEPHGPPSSDAVLLMAAFDAAYEERRDLDEKILELQPTTLEVVRLQAAAMLRRLDGLEDEELLEFLARIANPQRD